VSVQFASRAELGRFFRSHVRAQLYDDSGVAPRGTAIYSLSDPRDIRQVRYVGQSRAPRRRFLQHLHTAVLWLPEETPWWVKCPEQRPLAEWIRALYRDEQRLPVMVVTAWVDSAPAARAAERARIHQCLESRLQLLNVEAEVLGRQIPLMFPQ
jgi:hypothetical protein